MSLGDIEQSIGTLLGREVDYGEVFVQSTRGESFGLEDGIVKDGSFGVEAGIGVRGLAGEKTGFAYSEDIRLDGLREAAKAAESIAGAGAPRGLPSFKVRTYPPLYAAADPISSLSDEDKVSLLQRVIKLPGLRTQEFGRLT